MKSANIDRLVKSKIEVLNIVPPPIAGWNKTNAWKVIKGKIQNSNKTVIAWGFSIAASVSLLVAASFDFDYSLFFQGEEPVEENVVALKPELNKDTKEIQVLVKKQDFEIQYLEAKHFQSNKPNQVESTILPDQYYQASSNKTTTNTSFKNKTINPHLSVSSGSLGIYPSVGIDFKLFSRQNNSKRHSLSLGASTSFQTISTETFNKVVPFTYVTAEYSKTNENKNKGWSTKVGYLVNGDSNIYKKQTVKFSLNKKFNKHIKAGPELIFTNNFRMVYPGISIVLS